MKNMKLTFYFVFAGIGLFISLAMGIIMYIQYSWYIKTSYLGTLSRVARLVDEQYPVLHDAAKLKRGAAENADWFWETSRGLAVIARSFDIAYIYCIERTETGYVFLMSSAISPDDHPEWIGGPVWAENTPVPESIDEAWETQQTTLSKKSNVNEWGNLVYISRPFVKNGQTVGLLGAAYDISFVAPLHRGARLSLLVSLVASASIVGVLAFIGSRFAIIPVEEQKKIAAEANERRREIEKMLDALRAASDSKSAFLANISHEMRTPMNAIIGLSSVMLEERETGGELRENLEAIHNSGMMLLGVINDILDINKLEAGTFTVIPADYELPDMVNDISMQCLMRAENSAIRFTLLVDETLPAKLCGDVLRIKQICKKLLDNAFKYTKKGGVTLSVSCERGIGDVRLIITVTDTGVGIRPADTKRIFADYGPLDAKANRRTGGTGLGLAIVKRMAEMMDGSITVESEYGKGSVFTLRLRQRFVTSAQIGSEAAESLRNFHFSAGRRPGDQRLPRVRVSGAKALVVDDMITNQKVAKGLMQPCEIRVDCVSSGPEAIEIIRRAEEKYDIVFMDYMMPDMDGIETTKIIREKIGTMYARTVPVVALTAAEIDGKEKMFLQNGFNDFIAKPIDITRLDSVITRWVRDVG